ncbi:hypothetical protein [Lysinibacillus xylanilyticus]|uniref:hypothetical protein n=1 Tax=Lysinibacillus xylanilyticus TaxID=582475 RepID=UPI00382517FD
MLEGNNKVYCFKATSHLMYKNDEITHRGWHESSGITYAATLETQDKLRWIWHSLR